MRSIWSRAASRCRPSISAAAAPANRRVARFTIAAAISRSRRSSAAGAAVAFGSACRCALKNNAGSSRRRCRIAGGPPRQAAYSCPACLVSQ